MCEWTQVYQQYAGQGVYNQVSVSGNVQPGICPGCGKRLSQAEMRPTGRCSRSLCGGCYIRMFNRLNYQCVECGCDIRHKISLQQSDLREIGNHLCDSPTCRARWALRHSVVVGSAQSRQSQIAPQQATYRQPQPQAVNNVQFINALEAGIALLRSQGIEVNIDRNRYNTDAVDAEYVELNAPPAALPAPQVLQLPSPVRQMTVESLFNQYGNKKEKEKVVVVNLPKKKGWF